MNQIGLLGLPRPVPFHGARVNGSGTQSVPTDTSITYLLTDEIYEQGPIWRDRSASPTYFNARHRGWHVFCASVIMDAWSSGTLFYKQHWIANLGSGESYGFQDYQEVGFESRCANLFVGYCNGGDEIRAQFNQFSGATRTSRDHKFSGVRIPDDPYKPTLACLVRGSAQSFTSGVNTAHQFDTVVRDYGGFFDLGTFPTRITIPAGGAGWYVLMGSTEWGTAASGQVKTWFQLNGSATSFLGICGTRFRSGAGTKMPQAATLVWLNDGDYLELMAVQTTGGNKSTSGVNYYPAFASIVRVQPEDVWGAWLQRTTTQSIPASTTAFIIFDSEVRDNGGFANLGSNPTRLTAPVDGVYIVTGNVNWTAVTGNERWIELVYNGVVELSRASQVANAASLNDPAQCVSAVLAMRAGDYVELRVRNGHSAAVTTQANRVHMAMAKIYDLEEVEPEDYTSFVVLHLHFDGGPGFIDASSYEHPIQINGSPQIDAAAFKFGGASGIFGNGDTLQIADEPEFTLGTQDFTIEAWYLTSAPDTGVDTILSQRDGGFTDASSFVFAASGGSSTLSFAYRTEAGGSATATGAFNWAGSTWYHIAVCREGSNLRLFVDGNQVGATHNIGSNAINDGSLPFLIGAIGTANLPGNNFINGRLDDLRWTVGVARYTANFTPPAAQLTSDDDTVLLINFNGGQGFVDSSPSNHPVTIVGNARISTAQFMFGDSALLLDGAGDYLTIPDSADWFLSNLDFTIEWWWHATSYNLPTASDFPTIMAQRASDAVGSLAWLIYFSGGASGGTALNFRYSDGSSLLTASFTWPGNFVTGQWYSGCWCRVGANLYGFANGVKKVTHNIGAAVIPNIAQPLYIGAAQPAIAETYWNGWLEEIRILKGIGIRTSDYTPSGPL